MRLVPESEMPLGKVAKIVLHQSPNDLHSKTASDNQDCICDEIEWDEYCSEACDGPHEAWKKRIAEEKARIRSTESQSRKASTEQTWDQIRAEHDPDGKQHDLRLTCSRCGNSQTCRCSKPKKHFSGICPTCAQSSKEAVVKECEEELKNALGQKSASVFIFEDDPERIAIFKKAFAHTVITSSVKEALSMLRQGGYSRIYLDRDVSNPKENGEDVAWQMEREKLCAETPVVIHSENTRGQKVMAKYLNKYHSNVAVVPFKQLRRSLDVPGREQA